MTTNLPTAEDFANYWKTSSQSAENINKRSVALAAYSAGFEATLNRTLTPAEVSVILTALTRFGDTEVDAAERFGPRHYTADDLAAIATAQTAAADLVTKLESWLTPDSTLARPAISTLAATYARYQHLDHLLSDRDWLGSEFHWVTLADLWQAIKNTMQEDLPRPSIPTPNSTDVP